MARNLLAAVPIPPLADLRLCAELLKITATLPGDPGICRPFAAGAGWLAAVIRAIELAEDRRNDR